MRIIPNKDEWHSFWKAVDEYMQAYPVESLFALSFIALCMLLIALFIAIFPQLLLILLAFISLVFGLLKLCELFIRINR